MKTSVLAETMLDVEALEVALNRKLTVEVEDKRETIQTMHEITSVLEHKASLCYSAQAGKAHYDIAYERCRFGYRRIHQL